MLQIITKILQIDLLTHSGEILKGSFKALYLRIAGIISSYFFTILITRTMGADTMGNFALSFTVIQVLAVVGALGIGTALLRFVADFNAKDQWELIKNVYLKSMSIALPFTFLLSLLLYFFAEKIAVAVFDKPQLTVYLQIAAAGVMPVAIKNINAEALRGVKNVTGYIFTERILPFVFGAVLLAFMFWHKGQNSYFPLIAFIAGCMLTLFYSFAAWFKKAGFATGKLPAPKTEFPEKISNEYTRMNLFRTGLPMMISSSMFFVLTWTDTLVLGVYVGEEQIGIYNIAAKVSALATVFLFAVNAVSAPKFAELFGKKDMSGLERVVVNSTKMIFFSTLPVIVTVFFFPALILGVFGPEFSAGSSALLLLILGQFINAASGSVGYILQMTGNQNSFQRIIIIAAAINLLLNFLLIPHYGIEGAAFASLISNAFWNIASIVLIKRKLGILTLYVPFVK